MKKSLHMTFIVLFFTIISSILFIGCSGNRSMSDISPVSAVPETLKSVLKPEFFELLGKSRREIRSQHKIEVSENDFTFWYTGYGTPMDDTDGNVYLSYSIDGMSYDGLCDFISGEIERISVFEKNTTVEQFTTAMENIAQVVESDEILYRFDDYLIFVITDPDDPSIITRLTVKDQPK